MKEEIAAIENMCRLVPFHEKCIISMGEELAFEEQVYYADSSVFKVFPLRFLHGSPAGALVARNQIVISESIALKYFGTSDVVGESLKINNFDPFEIRGVTRDLPENVHHKLHMLISWSTFGPEMMESDQFKGFGELLATICLSLHFTG